jgi:hypothetical protein
MKNRNKLDRGKILVCRGETGLNEKIIIYDVDPSVPNTVGFVEYPIIFDYRLPPPFLASKFGQMGIVKNNQRKNEESLEKPGDWYLADEVSKDQMGILEELAKSPKRLLDKNEYNIGTDYPEKLSNAFLEHLLVKCQSK